MAELLKAVLSFISAPIFTLATALQQLGVLDPRNIAVLMNEGPAIAAQPVVRIGRPAGHDG